MTREEVEQICKETGITVLFADGFDDAIMGIGRSFQDYKVVYSRDKVIEILMKNTIWTLQKPKNIMNII